MSFNNECVQSLCHLTVSGPVCVSVNSGWEQSVCQLIVSYTSVCAS